VNIKAGVTSRHAVRINVPISPEQAISIGTAAPS
jgi:hypothetical protein